MIRLTQINYQKWHKFLGFEVIRKKSTTGEIFIDASKIISIKSVTPTRSMHIHKDFPTYTHIRVIGAEFGFDVTETPEEIQGLIKG